MKASGAQSRYSESVKLKPKVELPTYASTYTIDINGAQLALLDYVPTAYRGCVHLVHGFTGSKEDFSALAPLIAEQGYRVIAHDHRGCHQSSHTPGAYSLSQLASDVISVQRALGLSDVHLLGHSFGGLVARHAALQPGATQASLTLFCTGPARPIDKDGWLELMQDFLRDKSMVEAWDYMDGHSDHGINFRTDGNVDSVMSSRWRESDSTAIVEQADILLQATDRSDELAASGLPVHVVYGEFDDAWPLAEQDRVASVTHAPVSVISDAGHCPNEERPEATAHVLVEFWNSLGTLR